MFTCQVASSEKWTLAGLILVATVSVEYFSLNARLTISSLVSAFVGAAAAREMVATEVKEEGDDEEGEGGGEELPIEEEEEVV